MNRHVSRFAALCAFASLWFCAAAHAVSVRAWLDRSQMQLGETVTLNVQVQGDTQAQQPDFSALNGDFDLTGTQSSTSVNIVNGQTSSSVLWAVGLSPKHAGSFTIPALRVAGQSTQPLSLLVTAPSASATQPGGDVFVQTQVDPPSPYVQQQVTLSVKLYFAVNLIDGNLDEPQIPGAVVTKLGKDSRYSAQRGGRTYNVVERHYALTPENSGALTIPAVVFRGHAADGNGGGFFFNQGRAIGAQSAPITLDVRPRPASSGNDAWLPARSMSLVATGIDATTQAKVGEPLTLDLRLEAQGLGFEQLPKLELPKIPGADVYPDKPITQDKNDGQWLYGVRERKFAIVPNRAGTLNLPPISIGWWDTANDREQTASLPALQINVAPAANTAAPPASGFTTPASSAASAPSTSIASTTVPKASPIGSIVTDTTELATWRTLAFVALALWALTLIAWIVWLLRQRPIGTSPSVTQETSDSAHARRDFVDACKRDDLPAAARALLAWARHQRPDLRNLGDLARVVSDPAQIEAIERLERACYGRETKPELAARLTQQFSGGLRLVPANALKQVRSGVLPPLYPTASH
jgi:hypothetical protein